MSKQIFSALKVVALALVFSFGLSYVYAWTAPKVPPTGGNVSAPINTSGTAQIKTGTFTAPNLIDTSTTTQMKAGNLQLNGLDLNLGNITGVGSINAASVNTATTTASSVKLSASTSTISWPATFTTTQVCTGYWWYGPCHYWGTQNNTVAAVTLTSGVGVLDVSGNFRVGTTTSPSNLEVSGDIKIGNQNVACASMNEGSMHYNTSSNMMEYCDGSLWQTIAKVHPPIGTMNIFSGTGNHPAGIAYDNNGNMWTANVTDNTVTKINTGSGAMTTYSGTGASPYGIAFDGTNMWTANTGANSVTKITPSGGMTTYSGTGAGPIGIAFDGTNMWTANDSANSVSKISPTGVITTYSGTGAGPIGIAFDGTNMWTANNTGVSVTKITPSGGMTTYSGTGAGPYGITYDGNGNVWVADVGSCGVDSYSVTKVSVTDGSMTTYTGTGLSPAGIASDGAGNVWTTNYGNAQCATITAGNSVSRITATGGITTYSGTASYPAGIAFDGNNMWATSYYNGSNATPGTSVTKIQAMP